MRRQRHDAPDTSGGDGDGARYKPSPLRRNDPAGTGRARLTSGKAVTAKCPAVGVVLAMIAQCGQGAGEFGWC